MSAAQKRELAAAGMHSVVQAVNLHLPNIVANFEHRKSPKDWGFPIRCGSLCSVCFLFVGFRSQAHKENGIDYR